jgi:hypothetical protein
MSIFFDIQCISAARSGRTRAQPLLGRRARAAWDEVFVPFGLERDRLRSAAHLVFLGAPQGWEA